MGRASIVGAAETSVGKVRDHNEDSHYIDHHHAIFLVCDGMGGHAAGEVASALAVDVIRDEWASEDTLGVVDRWLEQGTPDAKKQLIQAVTNGVIAAHQAILDEATADKTKHGMGTTVVGAIAVGGEIVFAHAGDSRAYIVRDGIAMQLTEDHTLLARLLAAGIDVDAEGEGSRFKSMLTNALGIGHECKVSTFLVPIADGDRFLLCSDGITEYIKEAEIGEVLTQQPSPARSAQKLVELALARGGGDNATALVVRVVEAGETARSVEALRKDEAVIASCPLYAKLSPQQRLRALRIALPREYAAGASVPAQTLGDRVAWVIIDGEVDQDAFTLSAGAVIYPEALLADRPLPDKDGLAVARGDLRLLAIRADDFGELCEDDSELGEALLGALAAELGTKRPGRGAGPVVAPTESVDPTALPSGSAAGRAQVPPVDARGPTDPGGHPKVGGDDATIPPPVARTLVERASTEPARPSANRFYARGTTPPSGKLIVPASERAATEDALDRALTEITVERKPVAAGTKPEDKAQVESAKTEVRQALKRPDSVKPAPVKPPVALPPSNPEIHIEEFVEMEADEPSTEEIDLLKQASADATAQVADAVVQKNIHRAPTKPSPIEVEDESSPEITLTRHDHSDPEIVISKIAPPAMMIERVTGARVGELHRDVAELGMRDDLERYAIGVVGQPHRKRARRLVGLGREVRSHAIRRPVVAHRAAIAEHRADLLVPDVVNIDPPQPAAADHEHRARAAERGFPAADLCHPGVRVERGRRAELDAIGVRRLRLRG